MALASTWLTEQEASALISIPVETLRSWRTRKQYIPYSKIGRLVRYDVTIIGEFMKSQEVAVAS